MKKIVLVLMSLVSFAMALDLDFSTATANGENEKKYISVGEHKFQYIIATASKTGSYFPAGKKIARQLAEAVAVSTDGSLQNFDLLTGDVRGLKTNVALIQADILAYQCSRNPSLCTNLRVIPTNKNEFVTLVCRADIDLQGKTPVTVDVGPLNSGGSGSLDNIMRLEKDYNFKKVISNKIDRTTIMNINNKKLDCYVKTTSNPTGDITERAIQKGLVIKDLDDSSLKKTIKIGGKEVKLYTFDKIKYERPGKFFNSSAKTVKTNALLVVNTDRLSHSQLDKLLTVIDRLTVNGKGLF